MGATVQIPFLLVAAALGFGCGWFAFYRYINRTFEKRKSDWREILNHTEHEKNNLELKKEKLEKHLVESNKKLKEREQEMAHLEEEARAHGQQYKDMVTAYRESYSEKEGALTQQIDRLRTKANQTQVNLKTDQMEFSEESKVNAAKLAKAEREKESLLDQTRELQMKVDAVNAELSGSNRAIDELTLEAEKRKSQNIELRESLEKIQQEQKIQKEYEKELSVARSALDDSRNEIRKLKEQYNELVASSAVKQEPPVVEQIDSNADELRNLRENESILKDKIADLQEQVRHVEHQARDRMANERENNRQLKNDLSVLQKEKTNLASELLRLSANEKDRSSEEDLAAAKQALELEKNRVMTLEKEASGLSNQLKEKEMALIQEKTQASAATEEVIANLKGSLLQKEKNLESLEEKLTLLQKEAAVVKVEVNNNDELDKLKIAYDENKADLKESTEIISNLMKDIEAYRNKHLLVVNELERLKVSGAVAQNKVLDFNKKLDPKREQDLLKKYAAADKENIELRQKLNTLQAKRSNVSTLPSRSAKSKKPRRVANRKRANSSKDDLKLISGVGPVLEKELNKIGVSSFADVAAWKKADVREINDKLDLKGRVEREEWIKQAKALIKSGGKVTQKKSKPKTKRKTKAKVKPKAKRKAKSTAKKRASRKDNLQLISGVGPSLEKKLNKLGVRTFADVAGLKKKQISELDAKLNFKGRIEREQWVLQAREFIKA